MWVKSPRRTLLRSLQLLSAISVIGTWRKSSTLFQVVNNYVDIIGESLKSLRTILALTCIAVSLFALGWTRVTFSAHQCSAAKPGAPKAIPSTRLTVGLLRTLPRIHCKSGHKGGPVATRTMNLHQYTVRSLRPVSPPHLKSPCIKNRPPARKSGRRRSFSLSEFLILQRVTGAKIGEAATRP
jgi:hypothetical protein